MQKRKVLNQLVAKEFVVLADQESPAKYNLTGKAQPTDATREGRSRRAVLKFAAMPTPERLC
jgi:hypothetical protein